MSKQSLITSLDDLKYIQGLDKSGMMDLLMDLPSQILRAHEIAKAQGIGPVRLGAGISNIVFSGLGGSAIAGDIIKCSLGNELRLPFMVNRDYFAPGYVNSKTLFIASSYSGNTEETISAYKDAKKKKARIVVITCGGKLFRLARKDGYPFIRIPGGMPPRCALGYSFVSALHLLSDLRLIKDKTREIYEIANTLNSLKAGSIGPSIRLKNNSAKKMASMLNGRFCAVYGWSKQLGCVATRWRTQLGENAKSLCMANDFPAMNHNDIMAYSHPKAIRKNTVIILLKDQDDHTRIKRRMKITTSILKNRVHKIVTVESRGKRLISRIWSLIYYADFVSFYLAVLNKEDPTEIDEISHLKKELSKWRFA